MSPREGSVDGSDPLRGSCGPTLAEASATTGARVRDPRTLLPVVEVGRTDVRALDVPRGAADDVREEGVPPKVEEGARGAAEDVREEVAPLKVEEGARERAVGVAAEVGDGAFELTTGLADASAGRARRAAIARKRMPVVCLVGMERCREPGVGCLYGEG